MDGDVPVPLLIEGWARGIANQRPWLIVAGDRYSKLSRTTLRDLLRDFFIVTSSSDSMGDGPYTAVVLEEGPIPSCVALAGAAAFVLASEAVLDGQPASQLEPLLRQGRVVSWNSAVVCKPLPPPSTWGSAAGLTLLLSHVGVKSIRWIGFEAEFEGRPLRQLSRQRTCTVQDILALGQVRCEPLFPALP